MSLGFQARRGSFRSTPTSKVSAMAYVLLDEANLSPIEHYWPTLWG